jgi:hypothetical protein
VKLPRPRPDCWSSVTAPRSGPTVIFARMWRGWVPYRKTAEYVGIVERTGMAGYGRTPGKLGASCSLGIWGAGRTEIITLSWWPDVGHLRASPANTLSSPSMTPKTTSTSNHGQPHHEVASPADDEAPPHTFREDHP